MGQFLRQCLYKLHPLAGLWMRERELFGVEKKPRHRRDGVARIGVGYGGYQSIAGHWDIGAQMALTLEGDLFVRPAGGAEVAYVPIDGVAITLRQGFRLPRERDESLITAGFGVTIDRIAIDYAMEPMRGRRPVAHRLGLRIR